MQAGDEKSDGSSAALSASLTRAEKCGILYSASGRQLSFGTLPASLSNLIENVAAAKRRRRPMVEDFHVRRSS